MIRYKLHIVLIVVLSAFTVACKKDKKDEVEVQPTGHILFKFTHWVDGLPLQKQKMIYTNAAGNPYEVDEIKYFISDVKLHNTNGTTRIISDWKEIHYVDIDYPESLTWPVYDSIPAGSYTSISFTFGISKEKNKSFMYVNPPESNMMWPDALGGGYHYMMINGKWKDTADVVKNFNFHLGIGQIYNNGSITEFVQNYFTVNLPSSFAIESNLTREIEIIMNVDSWFKTPHVFDFNYWSGDIMQNQQAMQAASDNGADVFSIGSIK